MQPHRIESAKLATAQFGDEDIVVIQRFRGAMTMLEGRNAGGSGGDDDYGGGNRSGGDFGDRGGSGGGQRRPAPSFDRDLDDDVPF